VADKCGGCQWQAVDYAAQLAAKQQQVVDALERIGHFTDLPISPIMAADNPLSYRNKATYPLGLSAEGKVKAGYYRKGSHQIVNLNQCPVQDDRLDPLLAEVKQDIQAQGWSIYDEDTQTGICGIWPCGSVGAPARFYLPWSAPRGICPALKINVWTGKPASLTWRGCASTSIPNRATASGDQRRALSSASRI
jgi:hypothetical protein